MFKQIITPNVSATDGVGWCLRHTQKVFGAKPAYDFARQAWDNQKGRHFDVPPLGISVPVWFTWVGSTALYPVPTDLGHVAARLADGRVLSSPQFASQGGQVIYPSIDAMLRALGPTARYLGWSEYMHERQVVQYVKTDLNAVADAVIQGKYGNGQARIDKLTNEGFNARAVQDLVNAKLDTAHYHSLVTRTIRGEFGNGSDRRKALGSMYDRVQAEVNRLFGL